MPYRSYNVGVGNGALVDKVIFNVDNPGMAIIKNVAVGDSAMSYAYGSDNVALGYKTYPKVRLPASIQPWQQGFINTVSGYPNTAVGYSARIVPQRVCKHSLGSYSLTKINRANNIRL